MQINIYLIAWFENINNQFELKTLKYTKKGTNQNNQNWPKGPFPLAQLARERHSLGTHNNQNRVVQHMTSCFKFLIIISVSYFIAFSQGYGQNLKLFLLICELSIFIVKNRFYRKMTIKYHLLGFWTPHDAFFWFSSYMCYHLSSLREDDPSLSINYNFTHCNKPH